MKNPEQLTLLFEKYITGGCNDAEIQLLMGHFHLNEDRELLREMIIAILNGDDDHYQSNPLIAKVVAKVDLDLFEQIRIDTEPQSSKKNYKLWMRIAVAAAVMVVVSTGILLFEKSTKVVETSAFKNDIAPGVEGATLILANGKRIALSTAINGELIKEAGVSISKTSEGQLVYDVQNQSKHEGNRVNTLSTAKGETFKIRLPDGTLVVLNAASSLTYPIALNASEKRIVKLSGEAYFEVVKDKNRPFVVESRGQEVEVLGTHFNINSYVNEPAVKTTLLEGSVRVSNKSIEKILKPGTEAVNSGDAILINNANTEIAVAWKNKQFMFESENIQTIMRMVERWYDVEIIYSADTITDTFSGGFSRYDNVSELLQTLESTGKVKFKIDGKRVYVSK